MNFESRSTSTSKKLKFSTSINRNICLFVLYLDVVHGVNLIILFLQKSDFNDSAIVFVESFEPSQFWKCK